MNGGKTNKIQGLWAAAADEQNPERLGAFNQLFQELWGDDQRDEAIEVGYAWRLAVDSEIGCPETYDCAYHLGSALRALRRFDEAIELITWVLSLPNPTSDNHELGYLNWRLSECFGEIGELNRQETCLLTALEYLEHDARARGLVSYDLALLFKKQENDGKTASALGKSLRYFREAEDLELVAEALNCQGNHFLKLGHLDIAEAQLQRARSMHQFAERHDDANELLVDLARIAQKRGETNKALAMYDQAARPRQSETQRRTAARALVLKAELLWDDDRKTEASELAAYVEPVLRGLGMGELADQAQKLAKNAGRE